MIIRVIDLHNWADKRDSEGKLPLLVDKLIEFSTRYRVALSPQPAGDRKRGGTEGQPCQHAHPAQNLFRAYALRRAGPVPPVERGTPGGQD